MEEITELLVQARDGSRARLDAVFERLYPELKRLALARVRGGESTLSATALVHEAWLKLSRNEHLKLKDRRHFLACAARAMRLIVIDRVRAVHALRRGQGAPPPAFEGDAVADPREVERLLALDQALDALERIDPAQRELVELHWFAGLDFIEIAELRGVHERTVRRGWQRARAFLEAQLSDGPAR